MSSNSTIETFVAVDIGSINTRANLFDIVDGRFRLIATGRAPSTAEIPLLDLCEGVRQALEHTQQVTGRKLMDDSDSLIIPATGFGEGVDLFVASCSAGPPIRTVLVGLMPDVSLTSLRRMASSTYVDIVGEICLSDKRRDDERIDLLLKLQPDVIMIAGGSDGGASESLLNLVDIVAMALSICPENTRPLIIYAGNQHLGSTVVERMVENGQVILAPNVRPSYEKEDLTVTRMSIVDALMAVRYRDITGLEDLMRWSTNRIDQSADAYGRVIRYWSELSDPELGVLGVDLGASQLTLVAGLGSDIEQTVFTDLGLGRPLSQLLQHCGIEQIRRWLPFEISESAIVDYIHTKHLFPQTIPVERDELHLELALAREVIRCGLSRASERWIMRREISEMGYLPPIETILAGGAALSRAPNPGYAALTLLDSLQPSGVTTLVMDPYSLASALGAAAAYQPLATVQVLESSSFPALATVVAPVNMGRSRNQALHLRLDDEEGGNIFESRVPMGQLTVFPFQPGMHGVLTVRPDRNLDIGFGGPGQAGLVRVRGSALGIIVDTRGRPISLPKDAKKAIELNQSWLAALGMDTADTA